MVETIFDYFIYLYGETKKNIRKSNWKMGNLTFP